MSISRVFFRLDGPLTSRRLQNPSPVIAQRDEPGGEHHEHQPGAFPVRWPPNLETLAKPFAPVIAQMGRGGRRAS